MSLFQRLQKQGLMIGNCKFSDNHTIIPTNLIGRSYTADKITKLLANGKDTLKKDFIS